MRTSHWVLLLLLLIVGMCTSCSEQTYNAHYTGKYMDRKQKQFDARNAYYWRVGHFWFIPTFGPIFYLEKN